jgi:glutamyl-tRNA synthetase
MKEQVRVRFAPSPTGYLHIGGVRTALYNYLFARQNKGKFVLRIEDTDQTRTVPGAEAYITEALNWAGIEYDEGPDKEGPYGPYRQSERKDIYQQYADQLVSEDKAYYAFDNAEELEAMRERMKKAGKASPKYDHVTREYMQNSLTLPQDEVQQRFDEGQPYVIRLKVPRKEEVKLYDRIRGWVSVQSEQIDDKVLIKADGMPTYHMANVVDDHLMRITHVIRGEEWLPSAPLHVLLYQFLGWGEEVPEFAHLPLIMKPDGTGKLSKRDGEKGGFPVAPLRWQDEEGEVVEGYREQGYFPESFLNILAVLGWSPHDNREVFTLDELVHKFELERVGKAGAKFDPDKARWYNQHYLRQKPGEELAEYFLPELHEKGLNPDKQYVAQICDLVKEKVSFITEFYDLSFYFFQKPAGYDENVIRKKWDEQAPEFFSQLRTRLSQVNDFSPDTIEEQFKSLAKDEFGEKPGKFMQLFRVMATGMSYGPAIFDTLSLIGQQEVLERLDEAMQRIPAMEV